MEKKHFTAQNLQQDFIGSTVQQWTLFFRSKTMNDLDTLRRLKPDERRDQTKFLEKCKTLSLEMYLLLTLDVPTAHYNQCYQKAQVPPVVMILENTQKDFRLLPTAQFHSPTSPITFSPQCSTPLPLRQQSPGICAFLPTLGK